MSTVGYGDIACVTALGRGFQVFDLSFIFSLYEIHMFNLIKIIDKTEHLLIFQHIAARTNVSVKPSNLSWRIKICHKMSQQCFHFSIPGSFSPRRAGKWILQQQTNNQNEKNTNPPAPRIHLAVSFTLIIQLPLSFEKRKILKTSFFIYLSNLFN